MMKTNVEKLLAGEPATYLGDEIISFERAKPNQKWKFYSFKVNCTKERRIKFIYGSEARIDGFVTRGVIRFKNAQGKVFLMEKPEFVRVKSPDTVKTTYFLEEYKELLKQQKNESQD